MLGFGDRPIMVQTTRDSDAHHLVYPALGFIPTNREVPSASSTGDVGPPFTLHQVELIVPANARADMPYDDLGPNTSSTALAKPLPPDTSSVNSTTWATRSPSTQWGPLESPNSL
jgi:hypothetical protein